MGFGDSDLVAKIQGFFGSPADHGTVSLILRTLFLYGLLISLFRYFLPKKFKLWFVAKPSVKIAENSAAEREISGNAVGREELRRVFSTFDKNGDGLICKQEMRESFEKLRLCVGEEELLHTIQTVDVNGDGYVDFEEFVTLYESMNCRGGGEEKKETKGADQEDADLAEAFGVFDENGDGLITVEELQAVLKSLGLKEGRAIGECKKMIQKVDKDGDGMVNYLEFKEMMSAGFGRSERNGFS